ncbi:DUF4870 domain-containing protein [Calothrix sp. 336/3]|uniref:DUF4870 domain-containing protein n=1 Tax=Calothrix sp. 336/3 TaxID=1337936 RepID=UPI0004E345DB|nr:DUF4870 domain-containing protein [Calothrix sp. 336/3]AKG23811.1 hypothetical protein IJ00_23180 [Calothrix sp. 336/3]
MREKNNQQIRTWAMLCHLSGLCWIPLAALIWFGIPIYLPFLNILAPLIVWNWKKHQDQWIDFQGKESLNFQLSLTVYTLIVVIISLFLVATTCGAAFTSYVTSKEMTTIFDTLIKTLFVIGGFIFVLQLSVISFAAIKAYNGKYFRYPLTIRFLR